MNATAVLTAHASRVMRRAPGVARNVRPIVQRLKSDVVLPTKQQPPSGGFCFVWRWAESNRRPVRSTYANLRGLGCSKDLGYASMEHLRSRETELSFFKYLLGEKEKPDPIVMTLVSVNRISTERAVVEAFKRRRGRGLQPE